MVVLNVSIALDSRELERLVNDSAKARALIVLLLHQET